MTSHRSRLVQGIFFYGLLLAVGCLSLVILWPYLGAFALAAALSVILHPIHKRLTRWLNGYRSWAAIITIALLFLIVGLPISFIGYQIFQESRSLYTDVATNQADYIKLANQLSAQWIHPLFPGVKIDAADLIKQSSQWLITHFGDLFSSTASVVVNFLLGLVALFYLLRDGERFRDALVEYSPLPEKDDRQIIERVEGAIYSVLSGSVLVALIQGTVSGIGFLIFGVPNPALWGSVTVISALVPGLGTSLVLVPIVIYLFATGQTAHGVGMLLWSALAVGLIDNVLNPLITSRRTGIHPLFILFSVIGGLSLFGPLGFIFGPLTMSLLFALLEIYRTHFQEHRRR